MGVSTVWSTTASVRASLGLARLLHHHTVGRMLMHPMTTPLLKQTGATASTTTPGLRARAARGEITVAVVGGSGYAGGELLRLLAGHPAVRLVGVVGRGRAGESLEESQPHLAGLGVTVREEIPESDAVFLALPHGASSAIVPELATGGRAVFDLGPDFRLRNPSDYPEWYGWSHPAPSLLTNAVYGLPELHRAELAALGDQSGAIVGVPGCYPTATLLAVAPLAGAGLIEDLVVDAKSGVSGAGREPKPELTYAEVNENVHAYGLEGHRHTAEIAQELAALAPEDFPAGSRAAAGAYPAALEFIPHLVPMTRGILATCYVRLTRPVAASELADLYSAAYGPEPFVQVVDASPSTKHVLGSNFARVHVRVLPRSGRILALGVIDNLVKGAAGQAIQAFNVVAGLDETTGLEGLPIAP
jgi:N-acetyl-gamma-glutamyl-phosphate reductase